MENIVTKSELLPIRVGIDVGSTTVKVAILDDNDKILYGDYQRHRADIRSTIITVVNKVTRMVYRNDFKRFQIAPVLAISPKPFAMREMPIVKK